MAAVRPLFWIPVLSKLTKSVIRNCYCCKRFRATHYPNPKPGLLPRDRPEQVLTFEIVDFDYAGVLTKMRNDLKRPIASKKRPETT